LQIYSGGEKTPAPGTSKCYAFEFKGKIAVKNFLRFRQLSGPIGRFLHLSASSDAHELASKVPSSNHIEHFSRTQIAFPAIVVRNQLFGQMHGQPNA
jgi:hypothetical protein